MEPEEVYIFGHMNPDTDSICSAIVYAQYKRSKGLKARAARIGELNPETKFVLDYFSVDEPELIEDVRGRKVILVDHNEFSQSAKGIEEAEILEVIDHHKIKFSYGKPIFFLSKPLGSTATIIAEILLNEGYEIDGKVAGLLLAAILSDTVVFKSITTTATDKEIAKKLGEIAGIEDIEKFGIEIKKAKASIRGLDSEDVIYSDFKDFIFSGKKVGIGQVEIVDTSEVEEMREKLLEKMNEILKAKGYELLILMITNIIECGSELLVVGNTDMVKKAFGKEVKDNAIYLEGVMSRKSEVVPKLEEAFKNL